VGLDQGSHDFRKRKVDFHEAAAALKDEAFERPHRANEGFMKKADRKTKDDLRPDYDFANMRGGVRGMYAAQTCSRSNLVLLDHEIAKAFPADASVNQTLRFVLDLTSQVPLRSPSRSGSSKRRQKHSA
jgi:hypothetical protein